MMTFPNFGPEIFFLVSTELLEEQGDCKFGCPDIEAVLGNFAFLEDFSCRLDLLGTSITDFSLDLLL